MNQVEIGKLIAKLRKDAGYTQSTLADSLLVTDKAVSKWERGVWLPDSSLLPKSAGLLDTDVGTLIPDNHKHSDWNGLLILGKDETKADTIINGKPLIHYLMSYFLLLEITDVTIITDDIESIRRLNLQQYGFKISFNSQFTGKTFVVWDKVLLFGAYFTQQFSNIMAAEEDIIPVLDGVKLPFLFSHHTFTSVDEAVKTAKYRSLYRGMIQIPLNRNEGIEDAETLISIYEKYHGIHFCDLLEIARCRGVVL